jgi:uncharacterized membrane protein YbhN (UPF0104 family)
LLPAGVSAAVLTAIYWRLDWSEFAGAVAAAQWGWLTAGLLLVVPTTLIAAWRFTLLVPGGAVRLAESLKLTLAASVLNLALPSKMGDLTKAWFASRRGYMSAGGAVGVVLFEKAADLMALIALCLAGVLAARRSAPGWASVVLGPALAAGVAVMVSRRLSSAVHGRAPAAFGRLIEAWGSVQARMAGDRRLALAIAGLSLTAWLLHLVQIWLFARALAASPPLTATLAPAALAILAGLVPVTLAGIGTRDAALVYLFRDYLTPEGGAALGLLCTLRYLMPAVAGLAILREMAAPAQWDSAPEGSRPSRPATRS